MGRAPLADTPSSPGICSRAFSLADLACRTLVSDRAMPIALALVIAVAVVAPLGPLAANRFHHDEAVYSSWGLDIVSGRDLMVSGSPVDKPPLLLYLQALSFVLFGATEAAARLPSLAASIASVGLVYRLGQRLYSRSSGLLAAFLLAVSPFAVLFAPTAFTDPLLVALVLAACLQAAQRRWTWAGILLGLAAMTKQQGVLFVPLVVGLGCCVSRPRPLPTAPTSGPAAESLTEQSRRWRAGWGVRFAIGLALTLGVTVTWDLARGRQPGFLEQSLLSYSALSLDPGMVWRRLSGFFDMLRYGTDSPLLNGILVGGLPLLLATDGLSRQTANLIASHIPLSLSTVLRNERGEGDDARAGSHATVAARADLVLVGFASLFLIGHALVSIQVWDRYLLGLIPLQALLLARVLTLPWRFIGAVLRSSPAPSGVAGGGSSETGAGRTRWVAWGNRPWRARGLYCVAMLGLLSATLGPLRDAAASRLPVGGDHGAYDGIEQVVDYFKAVPADTTLYHRWLGSHWRFYLWGCPYDLRGWTSPDDLATQAAARPGARRYVVFPSWHSPTEARLALQTRGLALREVYRTLRRDGSVSFIVYLIQEAR